MSESDDRVIGTPQKLRWTYSDAKALEEAAAHFLFLTKELSVTTIRLFNTVGPRQTGKYGMVIPRFVQAAFENKPLRIFGDGNQSRAFCHVHDVVRAILGLSFEDRSIGEVYNVGGEKEISINSLANKIVAQIGSTSKIEYISYKDAYSAGFEDMVRRVPDISKINKVINWKPELSLENIIDDVARSLV